LMLDEISLRSLRRGSTALRFEVADAPYPREELDVRRAAGVPLGEGFISFAANTVPSLTKQVLANKLPIVDVWQEGQDIALVTRLCSAFLERGLATAVVVHRAGNVVVAGDEWLRVTRDAHEPGRRPFLAWVDLGNRDGWLQTYGMEPLWLPDVEAPSVREGVDDDDAYQRAHEAVQFACHHMVHRARPLEAGEVLEVPLCVQVGSGPHEELNFDLERTPRLR